MGVHDLYAAMFNQQKLKAEEEKEALRKKNKKLYFHRLNLPGETFHSYGTINKKKPKPAEDSDDDYMSLGIGMQASLLSAQSPESLRKSINKSPMDTLSKLAHTAKQSPSKLLGDNNNLSLERTTKSMME